MAQCVRVHLVRSAKAPFDGAIPAVDEYLLMAGSGHDEVLVT